MSQSTIDPKRFAGFLSAKLAPLNARRKEPLAAAAVMLKARATAAERDLKWARARHGADSGAAKSLKGALDVARTRVAETEIEIEKASIGAPKLSDKIMILTGRVTERGRGVEGLTVTAFDPNGKPVATACSGKAGIYHLEIGQDVDVSLVVSGQDQKILHSDSDPVHVEAGTMLVRDLPVAPARQDCAPPPDAPPKPDDVRVPTLVGFSEAEAAKMLEVVGLAIGDRKTRRNDKKAGIVLEQKPDPDTQLRRGSRVSIIVGVADQTKVPDLFGLTLKEAVAALAEQRLAQGKIDALVDEAHIGRVVGQAPVANILAPPDTAVSITIGMSKKRAPDERILAEVIDAHGAIDAKTTGAAILKRLKAKNMTSLDDLEKVTRLPASEAAKLLGLDDDRNAEVAKAVIARSLAVFGKG